MNIRCGLKMMLIAGFATAAAGACAVAQMPAKASPAGCFYIKLTAVPLNTPEELSARKHSVMPSAAYWANLYNAGKVSMLGSARDGETTFSVVILEGVSEAEAHSIAEGVPSVKAGVTTAEVLPMQVNLDSAPRPRVANKSR
jgi:uncharacterized protein YciI